MTPFQFAAADVPPLAWVGPFALLLIVIAVLPLVPAAHHWWERNTSKLLVALVLGAAALAHYASRGWGVELHDPALARAIAAMGIGLVESHGHTIAPPGVAGAVGALGHALLEYIPFITVLFALYCIAGGVVVRGDIPAGPAANTGILAIGGLLASIVGTTGAAMLLIRPLLRANSQRKRVVHTVVFFIFIVCNAGGCLLPIGDPPLFLGYLRGVPFLWTFNLLWEWALVLGVLLAVYYAWDVFEHRREAPRDIARDEAARQKLTIVGGINLIWLALVVVAVALVNPAKPFPGTGWTPPIFLREAIQLLLVGASFLTTPAGLRRASRFGFGPIAEVACLFVGIFITLQIPLEILHARGAELGLTTPRQFFWATGLLSSVLDNAPTYAVFFQTAASLTPPGSGPGPGMVQLHGGELIDRALLAGLSLGAVFMGALTYIGNGPNFMIKAIAEHHGVKMPGFFGFMAYSAGVMLPVLIVVSLIFFR